jgi:hypothetical protein
MTDSTLESLLIYSWLFGIFLNDDVKDVLEVA